MEHQVRTGGPHEVGRAPVRHGPRVQASTLERVGTPPGSRSKAPGGDVQRSPVASPATRPRPAVERSRMPGRSPAPARPDEAPPEVEGVGTRHRCGTLPADHAPDRSPARRALAVRSSGLARRRADRHVGTPAQARPERQQAGDQLGDLGARPNVPGPIRTSKPPRRRTAGVGRRSGAGRRATRVGRCAPGTSGRPDGPARHLLPCGRRVTAPDRTPHRRPPRTRPARRRPTTAGSRRHRPRMPAVRPAIERRRRCGHARHRPAGCGRPTAAGRPVPDRRPARRARPRRRP